MNTNSGPPSPMSQSNPVELMRFTQETIRRRVDEQLSPSDRLIAHSSEDLVMRYARTGFWVGTLAGGMFAFRSRLIAGRRAMQQGSLPRLFYPTKPGQGGKLEEELAKGAAQTEGAFKEKVKEKSADEMRRSKAIFFGKAVGYGILGSFIGTQSGVHFGRSASDRMLKNSGRQEAIQAAQQRGIALAAEEISQKTGGKINIERMKSVTGGRGGSPSDGENLDDGIGYQEPGRELNHDSMSSGIGYSDRAPPQENFPESLAGSAPSGSSLPGSSADSSNQTSRWDELRKSRANPPSSWDLLRDSSNKQASSSGTSPDGKEENASQKESRLDREKRKKEFEALFDQEAKGGDDNLGDKVWR